MIYLILTPLVGLAYASLPPAPHNCSSAEAVCSSNGTLLFTNGMCHVPLEQGPCAAGEWLRRDPSLPNPRHGGCFKRPCEAGLIPSGLTMCLDPQHAKNANCSGMDASMNAFGHLRCGPLKSWKDLFAEEGGCSVHNETHSNPEATGNPAANRQHATAMPITPKPCDKKADGTCSNTANKPTWRSFTGVTVVAFTLFNYVTL